MNDTAAAMAVRATKVAINHLEWRIHHFGERDAHPRDIETLKTLCELMRMIEGLLARES